MFKARFDGHSLLFKAEIDCITSQQSVEDTLVGKTFELIELKTVSMHDGNVYGTIFHSRIVDWWSQSYLVEANRIVCGLKDREKPSVVRKIEECSMDDLPKLSRVSNS